MKTLALWTTSSIAVATCLYAQEPPSSGDRAPGVEQVRQAWRRTREPDRGIASAEGILSRVSHPPSLEDSAAKVRARAAFVDLFSRADWAAFDAEADDALLREGLWKTAYGALDRGEGILARKAFEAYAAVPDADSEWRVRRRLLPKALLLMGEVGEATRRLEDAVAAEKPGAVRGETFIALGDTRLVAGEPAGAREAWEQAGRTPLGDGAAGPVEDVLRQARVRLGSLGRHAPPLDAVEVIGGEAPTWNDLKGKVVVVQVVETSCKACRGTMPRLITLRDRYPGEDLVVLGLTVVDSVGFLPVQDTPEPFWVGEPVEGIAPADFRAHLEAFRGRIGIDFPWLVQELSVCMAWNAWDPHPIVVVGRDGKIAFAQVSGGEISSVYAIVAHLLSAE